MNKDNDRTLRRLLKTSQMIIDEFDTMANLSYHELENTEAFNNHLDNAKKCLNTEAIIINNLDLETLKDIFVMLEKYDDNSDAYNRTRINLDNQIEKLYYKDENEEEYQGDEDLFDENNDSEETKLWEKYDDEDAYIEKYYVPTGELEKYEASTIDYTAINALKQMESRINNTLVDNKIDKKFKSRLLKDLRIFKYIVLSLDINLENIGVNYRFNLERIPNQFKPNIDLNAIAYNECVKHLQKLYYSKETEKDVSDINENLFNMICIEILLDELDDESLNKLSDLCLELEEHTKYQFYGQIAKEKILKKMKN